MQLHQQNKRDGPAAPERFHKASPLYRPVLHQGVTEEDWEAFIRRWDLFRQRTTLAPRQAVAQLPACCEPELESAPFREDPRISDKTEADILTSMKPLAVLSIALCARRTALMKTVQEPGESVRPYVAAYAGSPMSADGAKRPPPPAAKKKDAPERQRLITPRTL